MNRKIGILTYWGVPNYGAWTQAYALVNVLQKLFPTDDIKQISYLCDKHWESYYANDIKLKNNFLYSWNMIPHTKTMTEKELEQEKFDIIITGSDAIWEFSVPNMGNDIHLIGNKLNAKEIVSYAASFGVTTLEECSETWIKCGLSKYKKILVRDEHSKMIVEALTPGKDPTVVLDPSLLWDFNKDRKMISPYFTKYILVYGIEFDEDFIRNATEFAHANGYKLISAGFINKWCDVNFKMIELRCNEWIGLFKNAEYIFTSTFHGLMVGLSYRKQIKFNQVSYVKNRSDTLTNLLHIPNHAEDFMAELDYVYIERVLSTLRENSMKEICRALE